MAYLLYFDPSKKISPYHFSINTIDKIISDNPAMKVLAFRNESDLALYLTKETSDIYKVYTIYSIKTEQSFASYYKDKQSNDGKINPKNINSELFLGVTDKSKEYSDDAHKMQRLLKYAQLLGSKFTPQEIERANLESDLRNKLLQFLLDNRHDNDFVEYVKNEPRLKKFLENALLKDAASAYQILGSRYAHNGCVRPVAMAESLCKHLLHFTYRGFTINSFIEHLRILKKDSVAKEFLFNNQIFQDYFEINSGIFEKEFSDLFNPKFHSANGKKEEDASQHANFKSYEDSSQRANQQTANFDYIKQKEMSLKMNLFKSAKKYGEDGVNFYDMLGLGFGDIANLKQSHAKALLKAGVNNSGASEAEKNKQQIINDAKEILSDPEAKKFYDDAYLKRVQSNSQSFRPRP